LFAILLPKHKRLKSLHLRFFLIFQAAHNIFTEALFQSALDRAKELDTIFKTTKKTVGPLHGLPITIKESLNVKGTLSTLGVLKRGTLATEDAVIVQLAKEAGAIVFAKTNVPQVKYSVDHHSHISDSVDSWEL
jgi:amidase